MTRRQLMYDNRFDYHYHHKTSIEWSFFINIFIQSLTFYDTVYSTLYSTIIFIRKTHKPKSLPYKLYKNIKLWQNRPETFSMHILSCNIHKRFTTREICTRIICIINNISLRLFLFDKMFLVYNYNRKNSQLNDKPFNWKSSNSWPISADLIR